MDLIEELICFGLTRQEAVIYKELLCGSDMTGYEVSKQTGISRSNTYGALAGLVEKGAAYMIEGGSTRYTPVTPEEFCNNKLKSLNEIKKELISHVPAVREETDGYVTIKGEKHIFNKMRTMLLHAEHRVYLEAFGQNLSVIADCFEGLVEKGIKVVVITDSAWEGRQGVILYRYAGRIFPGRVGIITDTERVLTGEVDGSGDSTCLYSRNKNLVRVFRDMLKNEIKLIELQGK